MTKPSLTRTRIQQIDDLTTEMLDWVAGRRSHLNEYVQVETGYDRQQTLAYCAIADAQEVVKLSAAIQALTTRWVAVR